VTMTPAELQMSAAEAIERAVGTGGTGITFDIVQRSTLHARPDGEPLEIPDPADPQRTIAVEQVPGGTYLERGSLTPVGFHSEIRRGPDDPAAAPDWNAGPMWAGSPTRPTYVGITKNVKQRAQQHLRKSARTTQPYQRLTKLSRFGAHSVEQALMNRHGLARNGGRLQNKYNSVARTDPLYRVYVWNGNRLLRKAGYR
jgi:hypothetical protein